MIFKKKIVKRGDILKVKKCSLLNMGTDLKEWRQIRMMGWGEVEDIVNRGGIFAVMIRGRCFLLDRFEIL